LPSGSRDPNICGFKQAGPAPAATISLREVVGDKLVVSVADETPWLYNLSVMGDAGYSITARTSIRCPAICRCTITPGPR